MLYEYYLQTYRANTRGPSGPKKSQHRLGNMFRERKTNFSRRYNPPDGLKTFISSVKSDLRDPDLRNRNLKSNLTSAEKEAESELILLQKNRILTVTDKGSGIILMDTPEHRYFLSLLPTFDVEF